ncbi:hypothetical protein BDZ97DRAFT_809257 [Flammula alnicola]|nr:hypothetical protein BDZ97DRAFT_809257 [Flammula alnicola]
MANLASSVPIFKLHTELLLEIFSVNARIVIPYRNPGAVRKPQASDPRHRHRFSSLTITVRSSQVCGEWRKIILGDPLLWGSCIDFRVLAQKEDNWREEILRRTGDSLLSVVVNLDRNSAALSKFFSALLNHHWTRIRHLYIPARVGQFQVRELWNALARPAPHLQSFHVYLLHPLPDVLDSDVSFLFSGNAPSLRYFRAPYMYFNLRTPWLPQIRELETKQSFTVAELLDAYARMPLLEILSVALNGSDLAGQSNNLTQASLPRLEEISVTGAIDACLTLLEHIAPAPGCLLSMRSHQNGIHLTTMTSTDFVASARRVFSTYVESYFNHHHLTGKLIFSIYPSHLSFIELDNNHTLLEVGFPSIRSQGFRQHSSISDLLRAISSCRFSGVTQLFIHGTAVPRYPTSTILLSAFHSVKALKASLKTLQTLFEVPSGITLDNTAPVLPLLQTLEVMPERRLDVFMTEIQSIILPFLASRKEAGFPIRFLDLDLLTHPLKLTHPFNLGSLLGGMTGITLLWHEEGEVREYLVGSELSD